MIYIGNSRGARSNVGQFNNENSIINKILDFFHGQGVSASPIGYVRLYRNNSK